MPLLCFSPFVFFSYLERATHSRVGYQAHGKIALPAKAPALQKSSYLHHVAKHRSCSPWGSYGDVRPV